MKLTVAELFAGVGGFRVGLNNIEEIENSKAVENGPWKFVWANQFEPSTRIQHAYNCYTTRFGIENNSNEDINKVDKTTIPNHNLLVGGFPCQDYSVARSLSNEQGIKGKKGVLFWEIVDVLREKNTPFVLLENVDRLLKSPASQRGRDFAVMLKTLDDLGYNVHWRVINAGEYSMPQKRRRVFILAFKKDTKYSISFDNTSLELLKDNFFNSIFPAELKSKVEKFTLDDYPDIVNVSDSYNKGKFLTSGIMQDGIIIEADIIEITEKLYTLSDIINESKEFNSNIEKYIIDEKKIEKWKYLKGGKKIERVSKTGHKYIYSEGSMAFPENLDSPARTMLTSESTLNRSSHIIFDENLKKYRTLTPVEAEKIQMFPANWTDTMPDRNRFFMMGNALVTGIISRLEPRLREIIENE